MEKYILQILENNNRVIVPEFGAFIVKQRNPFTIVFNEFLQYNDGMLVDFISKTDGISRDDAREKIDSFVKKVNIEIEKGKNYNLAGLGSITKSPTGKISIEKTGDDSGSQKKENGKTQDKKENKPSAPQKPLTTATETVKQEKAEKKTEPTDKKSADTPKTADKPKEKPEPKESVPPVKKEITDTKPAAKESKEAEVEKNEVPDKPKQEEIHVKAATKPSPTSEPPISRPQQPGVMHSDRDSGNRKRTQLLLWIIIIVLVNGLLIGYFVFNNELGAIFSKKPADAEILHPEEDMLIPEEPAAEEPVIQEAAEAEATSNQQPEPVQQAPAPKRTAVQGPQYYVVAGVFRDENNADNMVRELRNKGYNSEKFGKIGNLYAVSYDVFTSKPEADRLLRNIQQNVDREAWIRTVK